MAWWRIPATLFFSATTHYFFKKYCIVASLSKHIIFLDTTYNIFFKKYCVVRHVRNTIFLKKIMCCGKFVTTHYFLSHNTLFFSKDIALCAMSATQYFLKKIMCCGKFVTTHYFFLPQHIIFF